MNIQAIDGRDMGALIPADLDDLGLDPYEFRIYCRLCRRAGSGVAYESATNMATACHISERKVRQCLKELSERGLIIGEARTGQPTLYRILKINPGTTCTPAPHAPHPGTTCTPTPAPGAPKGIPSEGIPIKESIGEAVQAILCEVPAFKRSSIPLKSFEEIAKDHQPCGEKWITEQARLARDWALEAPRYKSTNAKGNPATFFRGWLKRADPPLKIVEGALSPRRVLTPEEIAVIHR